MAQVNHQTTHGPMPREWRSLPRQGRFYLTVMAEGIWVWEGGVFHREEQGYNK